MLSKCFCLELVWSWGLGEQLCAALVMVQGKGWAQTHRWILTWAGGSGGHFWCREDSSRGTGATWGPLEEGRPLSMRLVPVMGALVVEAKGQFRAGVLSEAELAPIWGLLWLSLGWHGGRAGGAVSFCQGGASSPS